MESMSHFLQGYYDLLTSFSLVCNVIIPHFCFFLDFQGRKMKRWLSKDNNCLRIPDYELKSILYDVTTNRIGVLTSLFAVSPGFTGTVLEI